MGVAGRGGGGWKLLFLRTDADTSGHWGIGVDVLDWGYEWIGIYVLHSCIDCMGNCRGWQGAGVSVLAVGHAISIVVMVVEWEAQYCKGVVLGLRAVGTTGG